MLVWLMFVIVWIVKVHPGFNGADVSGCIDCKVSPWCW